jgi:tRNA(adenine34) deaminase
MATDHQRFMRLALQEAEKAGGEGNDGVGAVIARDGAVVALGRNLIYTTNDPTAHAETVAIRNAGTRLVNEPSSAYVLYTTAEPCPMCCGALMGSGIGTLVMGGRYDPGAGRWGPWAVEKLIDMVGWADRFRVVTGVLSSECLAMTRKWRERNVPNRRAPYL